MLGVFLRQSDKKIEKLNSAPSPVGVELIEHAPHRITADTHVVAEVSLIEGPILFILI